MNGLCQHFFCPTDLAILQGKKFIKPKVFFAGPAIQLPFYKNQPSKDEKAQTFQFPCPHPQKMMRYTIRGRPEMTSSLSCKIKPYTPSGPPPSPSVVTFWLTPLFSERWRHFWTALVVRINFSLRALIYWKAYCSFWKAFRILFVSNFNIGCIKACIKWERGRFG